MTDDSVSVDDTGTCHLDQLGLTEEVVREIKEKSFTMVQIGGDKRFDQDCSNVGSERRAEVVGVSAVCRSNCGADLHLE